MQIKHHLITAPEHDDVVTDEIAVFQVEAVVRQSLQLRLGSLACNSQQSTDNGTQQQRSRIRGQQLQSRNASVCSQENSACVCKDCKGVCSGGRTVVQPEVVARLQVDGHDAAGEGLQVHRQDFKGNIIVVELQKRRMGLR